MEDVTNKNPHFLLPTSGLYVCEVVPIFGCDAIRSDLPPYPSSSRFSRQFFESRSPAELLDLSHYLPRTPGTRLFHWVRKHEGRDRSDMIGSFKSSPFPLFFGGSLGADITAPSHWSHLHKQAEPVLEQASAVHHPKAVEG